MAYSAVLNGQGNYDISQDGQHISTGSSAILQNYGLSTTNLSSAAPAPTAVGAAATPSPTATPVSTAPAKPAISDAIYASQRQQVQQGTITAQQAQSNMNAIVSGGKFSDTSVDINRLFPTGTNLPKGTTYTNAQGQTVTYDSTGNAVVAAPAAPTMSSIPNVTTPPSSGAAGFTTQNGTAASSVANYTASVGATLDSQNAALKATNDAQIANYQAQIDANNQKQSDLQTLQDNNMLSENSTVANETAAKTAALQTEQQQYTDNYNAITTLAAKASALVDTSTALTDQMRNTTGLASIMNPRISQTAADLTAQLGVINGAVAIYKGQIGDAQNQLQSATAAITSIYNDQLNYYKAVNDYYQTQQDNTAKITATLTADQKTFIDANIKQLSDQIASTQATADYISKAMIDPTTALTFAKAGVTLNDTIPQIQQKLQTQLASEQAVANNDAMTKAGYSTKPIVGAPSVKFTDQYGKVWYKEGAAALDKTPTPASTEGSDLADAKTFLTANPTVSPADAKQAFLAKHPSSSAAWDSYWGVSSSNPDGNYPQPTSTSGGGFWSGVGNIFKSVLGSGVINTGI